MLKKLLGLMKKELIGESVKVLSSKNTCDEGIMGKIVDETRNTLVVETTEKRKTLLKKNIKLLLLRTNTIVECKTILKRSEERIK